MKWKHRIIRLSFLPLEDSNPGYFIPVYCAICSVKVRGSEASDLKAAIPKNCAAGIGHIPSDIESHKELNTLQEDFWGFN